MKKIIFAAIFVLIPSLSLAQQIRPGVVITQKNYKRYLPELKKLLLPGHYFIIVEDLEKGILFMPIVETKKYPQPRHYHQATLKYAGRSKIGPKAKLIGWVAGLPFPKPKSGIELAYNFDKKNFTTDQVTFLADWKLFDKGDRLERTFKSIYHNYYYMGRVLRPPIPEVPKNNGQIYMKECLLITEPFDVRGFSMIRTRFYDPEKWDEVYSYIPAIRRVRRLTGADIADSVLGSDAILDDFELCRQKITPKATFNFRVQDFLVPCHYILGQQPKPIYKGNVYLVEWEIRPCWVLEWWSNDPEYCYKKKGNAHG